MRYLYGHGLERKHMEDLFRLIQCLTALPSGLELKFREELATFEESSVMTTETLIAPLERMAMERGREEGRQEGWQKGQQEGWQKGQQEGRQEGRQEGLHQGSVVGRIQHTQELLGLPVADAAELASKDPAVLRALASELDARLKDQLARLRGRPSEN